MNKNETHLLAEHLRAEEEAALELALKGLRAIRRENVVRRAETVGSVDDGDALKGELVVLGDAAVGHLTGATGHQLRLTAAVLQMHTWRKTKTNETKLQSIYQRDKGDGEGNASVEKEKKDGWRD